MKTLKSVVLTISLGVLINAAPAQDAPLPALRLPNGEPLTCIYFFGHCWEPWMSSDDAIRRDTKQLREMGFNTLLLDHQFSRENEMRDCHSAEYPPGVGHPTHRIDGPRSADLVRRMREANKVWRGIQAATQERTR